MVESNLHVVIMAGGIGTRLWPVSTDQHPKQFVNLVDPTKSLLQLAYLNILPLTSKENIWVVSDRRFKSLLAEQLPSLKRSQFLLEPLRRNTAPCIGWAAKEIYKKNPDAVMVVVPADQCHSEGKPTRGQARRISRKDSPWIKDVQKAIDYINEYPHSLVTFGIVPSRPEIGFGYLEMSFQRNLGLTSLGPPLAKVRRFVEKPTLAVAKKMIQKGNYYWNSGIFVWKAKSILNELKEHLPSLYQGLNQMTEKSLSSHYSKFPNISIDYGVMEKSKNVYMVPASFELEDLGSWESVALKRKSRVKKWISLNSKNCFIDAPRKKVATIGVSNLFIIETKDALLICDKSKSQEVKKIVELMK